MPRARADLLAAPSAAGSASVAGRLAPGPACGERADEIVRTAKGAAVELSATEDRTAVVWP
jgi:hypothetical protein